MSVFASYYGWDPTKVEVKSLFFFEEGLLAEILSAKKDALTPVVNFRKLEGMPCHMVSEYRQHRPVISFCHKTLMWQTDRWTNSRIEFRSVLLHLRVSRLHKHRVLRTGENKIWKHSNTEHSLRSGNKLSCNYSLEKPWNLTLPTFHAFKHRPLSRLFN